MNLSKIIIQNPQPPNIPMYKENYPILKRSIPTSRHIHNYNDDAFVDTPVSKSRTLYEHDFIQALSSVRELKKNEILIHEGDDVTIFYEIIFGHIKTFNHLNDGRCIVTNFLRKGDFIGIPQHKKYTIAAQALTRTDVRCYSYRQLNNMMLKSPSLAYKMLNIAQKEISRTTNQMILLGRKSTKERIASFLLNCEHCSTTKNGFQSVIYLPMSLTDIADHLGLTQETVCRTLKKLRDSGLLKTKMPRQSREIYVRDMNSLSQIAETET